jgi:(1->4)-alpha-D-glucan 1-alpha-D-glucosylmutase
VNRKKGFSSSHPRKAYFPWGDNAVNVPISTYRLQLHKNFPFSEARQRISYLQRLGIGTVYLSPILLASPGSTHGYDICDHNRINPELGGEADFRTFAYALKQAGIGCLVDFVPNHMGADPGSNPWWRDVLENGQASAYSDFFDIDWEPLKPHLRGKVLLPILENQYGKVLTAGEIRLEYADGVFHFRYRNTLFPMKPCHVSLVLGIQDGLPMKASQPECIEFLNILTAHRNLPVSRETDRGRVQERYRDKEVARTRLASLASSTAAIAGFIEERVRQVNGTPGEARSFDPLHDLLERQSYRLAYWLTAGHEVNYRRFFDVNGLIGLRMENPEVFSATHGLMLRLAAEGLITGLRIDHVDGLYDPAAYLRRLRAAVDTAINEIKMNPKGREQTAVDAGLKASVAVLQKREDDVPVGDPPKDPAKSSFYIVVEKILCGEETLPREWDANGTTGYEFLSDVNGLFVHPGGLAKLKRIFQTHTGRKQTFVQEMRACKRLILESTMGSELNVLADGLNRLSEIDWNFRDFTLKALRDAVREVIACLAVYRTYGTAGGFSDADRLAIESALMAASRENPTMESSIFRFLRLILLPPGEGEQREETSLSPDQRLDFAMKMQQLTGAVQAKGVEDTAFYRHMVLLSLNEVGGDPGSHALMVDDFHRRIQARSGSFPHALVTTATHDTKRGEDARARLNVLSEIPRDWQYLVSRLSRLKNAYRRTSRDGLYPCDEDAYLLFQSLVGCWPVDEHGKPLLPDQVLVERMEQFLGKAAKEAKLHTSWINPNESHKRALDGFLKDLLLGGASNKFTDVFFPLLEKCARLGALHSLNQIACKCAVPGVPDIYQGTEGWDLSLVDPDNRRPVDYMSLNAGLAGLEQAFAEGIEAEERRCRALELLAHWPDGRVKQFVLWRSLQLRKAYPLLFQVGAYVPLQIEDRTSEPIWMAFCRRNGSQALVVCIRLRSAETSPNPDARTETLVLPLEWMGREFTHVFTGTRFQVISRQDEPCGLPMEALAREFPTTWLLLEPDTEKEKENEKENEKERE